METLDKPFLGDVTAITMSTPDLDSSFEFYSRLGFRELLRSDFPIPFLQMTDGALLIMLRKDTASYIALTYYVKDLEEKVSALKQDGIEFTVHPLPTDMIKRYVLKTPDGLSVSLVTFVEGFVQPAGPTMLHMPQADYFDPSKYVNKSCGMFGEFAHPVKDLDASIEFWKKLGFKTLSKMTSPYPWAIISDGLAVVGLHQTTHFNYPAITFFAVDMPAKIEALKATGIDSITETGKGNIVLNSPENQHINLFKLGF